MAPIFTVFCLGAGVLAGSGPARAEPLKLLALGDSLTQGYGLAQGEGLVPQLEAWLQAEGRMVEVINAGVSGDTTAGGLARVEWSLGDDPDAMMVVLGGNDLLRGMDPAATRANLDGILQAGASRDLPMLLAGMQASMNYGAGYKAAFDGLYPDLAEEYDTVFLPSFLDPVLREGALAVDPALIQADGIHPNAEGVQRIVAALGPAVLEVLDRVEE